MTRIRRVFAWALLPVALSGFLRVFHLARSSYWLDEMVSLDLAQSPHWLRVFSDNNPPLYGLILRNWMHCFGDSEGATRAIAAVCSVMATALVMMAVWEIRKQWSAACLAGGFHALCLLSLSFAQQARMYGLFELGMALSLYFFVRMLRNRGGTIPYALTCIGMALTHYLAIIPIMIELAVLAFGRSWRGRRWTILVFFAFVAACQCAIYRHFFSWQGLQWQLIKSSAEPLAFWPGELLWLMGNGSYLSSLLAAGLFGLGIFQLLFIHEEEREARLSMILLVVVPILVFSLVTLWTGRALMLPRYFIYVAPPFSAALGLTAAWAFARANSRRKTLAAALAGIFLVGSGAGLREYYSHHREPWREAASIVARYPGSVIATTRTLAMRTPYFKRIGVEVYPLPEGTPAQVAWIAEQAGKGKKVWIVENFWGGYRYMPELKQVLAGVHLGVSELSLRDGDSPPVFMMMVEKQ